MFCVYNKSKWQKLYLILKRLVRILNHSTRQHKKPLPDGLKKNRGAKTITKKRSATSKKDWDFPRLRERSSLLVFMIAKKRKAQYIFKHPGRMISHLKKMACRSNQ